MHLDTANATDERSSQPPRPTFEVGHVGLNVTDLDRSIDFYTDVLALELLNRSDAADRRFAFLGLGGELRITLWQQSQDRFATDRPGLHHLAFQVQSAAEVEAVDAKLRARGAKILHGGVVAHSESSASGGLFFEDPDGSRLEVYTADIGAHPAPSGEAPSCGFF
ncbi:MAG: VOC family protein [Acidobacteriota bacterium]